MSGNHAFARPPSAGCRSYFGYPNTPQNELGEYMAEHLPKNGGVFVQSESETAAINMVIGAAATGTRVMTSSSSPGISLKQEGISFLAGFQLPAVIVNVMRGGPGLGNIAPAQGDYFQATRGGGHGDYRTPVFAPGSVQEVADLTRAAFDVADRYRTPVMILGDGMLGQMKEPVEFPEPLVELPEKEWALKGRGEGASRFMASLIPTRWRWTAQLGACPQVSGHSVARKALTRNIARRREDMGGGLRHTRASPRRHQRVARRGSPRAASAHNAVAVFQ
jgi:2-oxoglutarate ferredoxin oxidoreductase subunit alpha